MNPDPFAPIDPDTPLRFDHLLHLLTNFALCVAAVVVITSAVLIYWRLALTGNLRETVRLTRPAPVLTALGTYLVAKALQRCGLSASEQVTRPDNEGRQATSTRWFHPTLLGTEVSRTTLRLTVRTRMGQTVEDLERAVPAIRDAAGAHSARSVVVSPGTLRIELVMREQLSTAGHAAPRTGVATARVTLGRCENEEPWTLPLGGRHTLTMGCSGAGKGSVFWGLAGGLGPAVAAGTVRLAGIDLK